MFASIKTEFMVSPPLITSLVRSFSEKEDSVKITLRNNGAPRLQYRSCAERAREQQHHFSATARFLLSPDLLNAASIFILMRLLLLLLLSLMEQQKQVGHASDLAKDHSHFQLVWVGYSFTF